MPSSEPKVVFVSSVAPLMEQFVRHKRAIGYRYQAGAAELKLFDRFLSEEAPEEKDAVTRRCPEVARQASTR